MDPALRELLGDEVEEIRPPVETMIHRGAGFIKQSQADFDTMVELCKQMARAAVK